MDRVYQALERTQLALISLQEAIEAHIRGEMVDVTKCPNYAGILNARLESIQKTERDLDGFINGPL